MATVTTELLTPTGTRPVPNKPAHIPALDGLRGIAVLGVLIIHYCQIPHAPGRVSDWIFRLSRSGATGVDLFFVLSGFLITGILMDAKNTPHYFRNFYARRTLRIFPLYYGVLALFLIFAPHISKYDATDVGRAFKYQAWYWLYAGNLLSVRTNGGVPDSFSHFWSLAVEEHFYLVWPAVVLLCDRRALVRVCWGLIVGCLASRCVIVAAHVKDVPAWASFTPLRVDTLAAGALLAIAARSSGLARLERPAKWVALVSGTTYLALGLSRGVRSDVNVPHLTIGYTLLAALFASVLVLSVQAGPASAWGRVTNATTLRFLGKYSYGAYVLHMPLKPLVARWMLPTGSAPTLGRWLTVVAVGIGCSIAAAVVSWHLYEKHFLRLKRFFEYRHRPAQ